MVLEVIGQQIIIPRAALYRKGAIPNRAEVPGHVQVNLSISHRFETVPTSPIEVRLDVINLFDRQYEIHDGSGVGVFAAQYGPRRGFFGGITKEF